MNSHGVPALGNAKVTVTTTAQTIEQLLAAASALGGAIPSGTKTVTIQPRGGDVRFTDDGQTPTSVADGLGLDIYDGQAWFYNGPADKVRLIGAASITCTLAFYG